MANVITVNSPQPMEYVQHFLDSYQQNRARRSAEDLQRQQLDNERQKTTQEGAYQAGTLANDTSRVGLAKKQYADTSLDADVLDFIKTAVDPYVNSGRPEDAAVAAQHVQQALAAHPDWKEKMQAIALRLQHQTPQDQTNANVGQFSAAQTAAAAGGSTDPNATAFTWQKATGKDIPSYAFVQQQANDLATQSAAGNAPNLKGGTPKPSGKAVGDYEARATGAMTTAPENQQAQTSVTTTGMQEAGATKRTAMTLTAAKEKAAATSGATADPAKVANAISAIQGAAKQGISPDKVLKTITDKGLKNAVVNELMKPENQSVLAQSPLGAKTRENLASLDPIIAQAAKVAKAFEPYKDDNGFFTGRDLTDYALYMAGKKPPDDSPASQLANLQMLRIQAGTRLLKGGSRAYQALEEAMVHAGNGKETRAQIYDKTSRLLAQLQTVREDEIRFGVPMTAETATAFNPAVPPPPAAPSGAAAAYLKSIGH